MLENWWKELSGLTWMDDLLGLGLALAGALVLYWLVERILVRLVHRAARHTQAGWDDVLVECKVFSRAALFAPAVALTLGSDWYPEFAEGVDLAVGLYLIGVGILLAVSLLSAVSEIYARHPMAARRPIRGVIQLAKLFVVILGVVAGVALLLGTSPWAILSGIGAMTAVILLVFKDTLLSLVAGVQMAAYDLLRVGDWLEMPAFGADGDVIDISLNTVRVQNFDKTIVAVPTHKFLESSFKNWRGMTRAGGRRIKRALILDQSSVRFVDRELMGRFESMHLIRDYMRTRAEEIARDNERSGVDASMPVNGRRMTNLGCFRAYAVNYLLSRSDIHKDMTLLVRQLAPSPEGLPLEIYAFTADTAWAAHEETQSAVFDHLLAALPWFDLRIYQRRAMEDHRPEWISAMETTGEGK